MNERIEDLLKQVRTQRHTENLMSNPPKVRYSYTIQENDLEKFAESIIMECIEQIQLSTARDPHHTPQYKQSVGHIHRIRQHFGIGE